MNIVGSHQLAQLAILKLQSFCWYRAPVSTHVEVQKGANASKKALHTSRQFIAKFYIGTYELGNNYLALLCQVALEPQKYYHELHATPQ